MVRRGDLTQAQNYFRAAIKLDSNYPPALTGLAYISYIYSSVSHTKTARALLLQAYHASPDDPVLMLAHANTLKGDEHLAALEEVLPLLDPESEEARGLRAPIALDRALHGRKVRRLASAYQPARIKLVHITTGPDRLRGFGLRVQFNQLYNPYDRHRRIRHQHRPEGGPESGARTSERSIRAGERDRRPESGG